MYPSSPPLSPLPAQERVVPEYSFLDPRGMGIFDGKEAASILPEVSGGYTNSKYARLW